MDTLLKETVNATVNSRYPGMAPEGRKLIEDILIRKELEKGELLFKEGQVCHHMVFVGKGMMRQFYYKNGKDVTEHFSYQYSSPYNPWDFPLLCPPDGRSSGTLHSIPPPLR